MITRLNRVRSASHLPLIAIPRLLSDSVPRGPNGDAFDADRDGDDSWEPLKSFRSSKTTVRQGSYRKLESLSSMSVLDFAPELLASSIADLWRDLASNESKEDFLLFQKGWIGHVVLLGCLDLVGAEVIERMIELACCLDLLCREHELGVAVAEALKSLPVARVSAWKRVRGNMTEKVEDILGGRLSEGAHQTRYRAPRDAYLEYWILSRAYADNNTLLKESMQVEADYLYQQDVEARLSELEILLGAMDDQETQVGGVSEAASAVEMDPHFSEVEPFTENDTDSIYTSTSEEEGVDPEESDSAYSIAKETRERVSLRLEKIKDDICRRSANDESIAQKVELLAIAATIPQRYFDPLDQRALFRASSKSERAFVSRSRVSATYSEKPTRSRSRKTEAPNVSGSQAGKRDGNIPTDAAGRWQRNGK